MELDQFMEELLWDFWQEIIELFFPDLALQLDFSQWKDLNKELYTESPKGEERFVDVLFEVRYQTPPPSVLLVHFESQQQKRFDFPARMLGYQCLIYQREIERERKDSFSLAEFTEWERRKHLLSFVLDNPVVCALAVFMDLDGLSKPTLKIEAYRKLLLYLENLTTRQINQIIYSLETYLTLTEEEKEVYQRLIQEVYPEVNEMITNPLIERGRQQELQESVVRILSHRFQKIPKDLQEKIASLTDIRKLRNLLDASIEVESLEELQMNGFFDD